MTLTYNLIHIYMYSIGILVATFSMTFWLLGISFGTGNVHLVDHDENP